MAKLNSKPQTNRSYYDPAYFIQTLETEAIQIFAIFLGIGRSRQFVQSSDVCVAKKFAVAMDPSQQKRIGCVRYVVDMCKCARGNVYFAEANPLALI